MIELSQFKGPEMTSKKPGGILYHYCSNAAFLSIISSQAVWASEFSLSNDTMEGKWIREVIIECCHERGLDASQLNIVLREFDTINSMYGAAGLCLSEDGDMLSQWRAYSDNGAGVSIGFDSTVFTGPPGSLPALFAVEYELEDQKRIIAPNIDLICRLFESGDDVGSYRDVKMPGKVLQVNENITLNMAIITLLPIVYSFKNPAFREEREWRGGRVVAMASADWSTAPSGRARNLPADKEQEPGGWVAWALHQMEYRALVDRIVPYRAYPLDSATDVIREVILGPRNITPSLIATECLRRQGWYKASVRKSSASYR
jgi:hypothetical protein